MDPILLRLLDAAQQLGWPRGNLYDLEHQYGVSIAQNTQSSTNRAKLSTATAFIERNILRPNLHVLVNAFVTRILFRNQERGENQVASGVEFIKNNQTYQVMARQEVIISGGTVNTARLLMLSGIGPRQHLSSLGIPIVADLPVGQNLIDQPMAGFNFMDRNDSDITISRDQLNSLTVENLYQFLNNGTGRLTNGLILTPIYIASGISGDQDFPDGMMFMMIAQFRKNFCY